MSDSIAMPKRECPCCGKEHDRTTQVSGMPRSSQHPGDIVICADCGAACRLSADLDMVLIPKDVLASDPYLPVRELQARVRSLRGLPA